MAGKRKRASSTATGNPTSTVPSTGGAEPDNKRRRKQQPPPLKNKAENNREKLLKQNDDEIKVNSIIFNGNYVPVDPFCVVKVGKTHVYVENGIPWSAILVDVDLKGKKNICYIIQLLKDVDKESYSVWTRWGKIGYPGRHQIKVWGRELYAAKAQFECTFAEKTHNEFFAKDFEKYEGKYGIIYTDYLLKAADDKYRKRKIPKSKLDSRLQSLMKILLPNHILEKERIVEMKYNLKIAPFGKLSEHQIQFGYDSLDAIRKFFKSRSSIKKHLLHEAINNYYSTIPQHGSKVKPILSEKDIEEQKEILQQIKDISPTVTKPVDDLSLHQLDKLYTELKCELVPLDETDEMFQVVEKYFSQTKDQDECDNCSLDLLSIFNCKRETEMEKFKDVGNRVLLWHGTHLCNVGSILKRGLKIFPKETYGADHHMFGRGVFFADRSNKSVNYCLSLENNTIILFLCEVSLGKTYEIYRHQYYTDSLPAEYNSLKLLGQDSREPPLMNSLSDGTQYPVWKSNSAYNSSEKCKKIVYNEYIVYDTDQIKLRYVIMAKFKTSCKH